MKGKTSDTTDVKTGYFTVVCLVSWCMNAREAGPCFDTDSLCFSFIGQMNQNLDIFSSDILKRRNVKQTFKKKLMRNFFSEP